MITSPKICPTCKREKCDVEYPHSYNPCQKGDGFCHSNCPPAEKEADEMKVAMNVLKKSVVIQGNLEKLIVDVDLQKNIARALQEAKAQGRREMKSLVTEAVERGIFIKGPDGNHAAEQIRKNVADVLDTIKD